MNVMIEVARSELNRLAPQWDQMTIQQRRWAVSNVLRDRGDGNSLHFAGLVERNVSPYNSNWVVIEDR